MKVNRFSILAVAAALATTAAVSAPSKSVSDGIAAWQRSDYAGAVAIWRPLAQKGDADAAFNLGQAYRLGRGVPVDLAQAQSWLEKSANAGHLDAQTTLGLLLFDSGNSATGMRWLKQAAQRGEPRAMLVYGTALFNGDGAPRDPVLAYAYVSRAAAQGLQPAKATLQEMDNILPVDVRQKAVKIAIENAAERPAPTSKAAAKKTAADPAKKPPQKVAEKTAPAPKASNAPSASGPWRIQLGAFSKRSSAEALYAKLSGKPPVAGHAPLYVPAGAVTRLQVGGFSSRAAAEAACAALSAKGQACFAVAGK